MKHKFKIFWIVKDEPHLLVRILIALRKYGISPFIIKTQELNSNERTKISMRVHSNSSDIGVAIKKVKRLVAVIDVQYAYEKY